MLRSYMRYIPVYKVRPHTAPPTFIYSPGPFIPLAPLPSTPDCPLPSYFPTTHTSLHSPHPTAFPYPTAVPHMHYHTLTTDLHTHLPVTFADMAFRWATDLDVYHIHTPHGYHDQTPFRRRYGYGLPGLPHAPATPHTTHRPFTLHTHALPHYTAGRYTHTTAHTRTFAYSLAGFIMFK